VLTRLSSRLALPDAAAEPTALEASAEAVVTTLQEEAVTKNAEAATKDEVPREDEKAVTGSRPSSSNKKSTEEATDLLLAAIKGRREQQRVLKRPSAKAFEETPTSAKAPGSGQSKGKNSKKGKGKQPFMGHETTRHQYMCRTGLPGPGQTKAFKFSPGDTGDMKRAQEMAEEWVMDQKRARGFV